VNDIMGHETCHMTSLGVIKIIWNFLGNSFQSHMTYVWHHFYTIKFLLEKRAMHVQVCKSFGNKTFGS
jgi:hypothetical protein